MTFLSQCLLASSLVLTGAASAAPAVGAKLPELTLSGEAGGRIDGTPWSSSMIKDKVFTLFYISPSHRNDNEELKEALAKEHFPEATYGTIAVVNMAASWLPNAAIASSLAANQEKYPKVIYVKDMNKALVKQWHLPDDAFAMLIFDRQGRILLSKDGDLSATEVADVVALIKKNLNAH